MSDDSQSGDSTFDSETFGEWVENTAQNKGISRGELFDQMLSSYWILQELIGMMDEEAEDGPATQFETATGAVDQESERAASKDTDKNETAPKRDDNPEADVVPEPQELSDLVREFHNLRSAILEMTERKQSQRRSEPTRQWDDRPHRSSPPDMDTKLRRTLEDLQDRVEDLSTELAALETRHDNDIDQIEADVEDTLDALQDLESANDEPVDQSDLEALSVSVDEELSKIQETTTVLKGRVAQVEETQSAMGEEVSDLRKSYTEQDERLEREFDNIEDLFQHLLDKTDDLEYRLGAIAESYREDLEPVEEHIEERTEFEALMRKANRKGVSKAVCDNCDETVDLRVLQSAHCPDCDRTYSDVRDGGWLPFSEATLETEPMRSSSEGIADGPPGSPDDQPPG